MPYAEVTRNTGDFLKPAADWIQERPIPFRRLFDGILEYPVHPRVTFTGYLGYAPGRAITATIYPKGKSGAFGYLELL